MKAAPKAFKNVSIFQGYCQYFDHKGTEWRRENGEYLYKFYRLDGTSFIFMGHAPTVTKKEGVKATHDRFMCMEDGQ